MRILTVILCLACSITWAQSVNLEMAEQLATEGRYTEALVAFNLLITQNPGSVESVLGRAGIYEALSSTDKAVTDYSIVLELDPNHWEARFSRAVLWFKMDRLEQALKDFEMLLKASPPETNRIYYAKSPHSPGVHQITTSHSEGFASQLYNYIGLIQTRLKNYPLAFPAFNKAIELNPRAADYYLNRALLKEIMNDSTYRQDYERAAQLSPGNALLSANKATLPENERDAERYLTEAIANDSLMVSNYIQRGYLRMNKKDYSGALQDFNDAIDLNKTDVELWLNRGVVKMHLKNITGSIRDFTQAIELKPDYEKAWLNRGNAFVKLGEYEKAIEDYSVAITYDPEYAAAFYNRALVYHKLKKIREACSDFERASALGLDVTSAKQQICK